MLKEGAVERAWIKRERSKSKAVFLIVALLIGMSIPPVLLARELVVTTIADSGRGSLRWALLMARPGDVIKFDPTVFPPDDPATIHPLTELPPITCGGVTIDASDAGVIIDGSKVPGDWNNGLQVYSGNNVVMGLQIVNFKGSGIAICGRDARNNVIGGDRSIGAGPIGQGNLVSGNTIGIDVCDFATDTVIQGNLVGTDATGEFPWGNKELGIFLEDGVKRTRIGPNNVVAYNNAGIVVSGSTALANTITRNAIYRNLGPDISLEYGGNTELAAPAIFDFDLEKGSAEGKACPQCVVEIFSGPDEEGMMFEGSSQADDKGDFTLQIGHPFEGPHLTATATDLSGNTSSFSLATSGTRESYVLQQHNKGGRALVEVVSSEALANNRIGVQVELPHADVPAYEGVDFSSEADVVIQMGFKSVRLELDKYATWWDVDWDSGTYELDPTVDEGIDKLADSGVRVIGSFGPQADWVGKHTDLGRFRVEQEVQQFLGYVSFYVQQFRGRIGWWEIWNEPDVTANPDWYIRLPDYVRLIRRVVPVIKGIDPKARVVIGAVSNQMYEQPHDYLLGLLKSDVVRIADAISWHPMYGTSPKYEELKSYYYEYPSVIREIKATAEASGFMGEFIADELNWRVEATYREEEPWIYSGVQAAKYYARGLVTHVGMDITAEVFGWEWDAAITETVRRVCTVMEGHEAIDMPVQVDIDYPGPVAYCSFRYPNGDRLLAIWIDGIAQDEDPGVPATIRFPGLVATSVTGIDILYGFQQELDFQVEDDATVVRGVLVRDYPTLIRLSGLTFSTGYSERVGNGFHRFGDVDAVSSGANGESDRDGDGVPDNKDYCPDWPGSKESNGC